MPALSCWRIGRRWRTTWMPVTVLATTALALPTIAGAFSAELTDHADEAAHFVSSLLVRDYLAHGLGRSPMDFAREYYAHYPKVGIGNWPPGFYVLQGIWMSIVPARPASVLVLNAVLLAVLAWTVFRLLLPRVGHAPALFGALLVVLMPPVPQLATMVMVEIPLALLATIAVHYWARFLSAGRARDAVTFAAIATAAALTKGNGFFLIFVPPLSILICRRWPVLRSPAVRVGFAGALLVSTACTSYLLTVRRRWPELWPSLEHSRHAVVFYPLSLVRLAGFAISAMVVLGLWSTYVARDASAPSEAAYGEDAHGEDAHWASFAAVLPAVLLLNIMVPVEPETRHLVAAYPAVAQFAALGTHAAARWARRWVGTARATPVILGVVGVIAGLEIVRPPPRTESRGLRAAAAFVLAQRRPGERSVSLIVSDAPGEGAYVVEVALRDDDRPHHVVWRGTKLLAQTNWMGGAYRPRAVNDTALIRLLERASVRLLVLDRSTTTRWPHQVLLERAVVEHPERFQLLRRIRRGTGTRAAAVDVYAFACPPSAPQTGTVFVQAPGYDGLREVPGIACAP